MLNHITIMGRLVRDPELRRTGSGIAVASFTVAVDRDFADKQTGEKETDFIDCVAWRQTGEFVSKFFTKGKLIVVSGRLQIRNWTDNEGAKRRSAEIVADNCYFAESKKDSSGGQQGGYNNGFNAPTQQSYGGEYAETENMLKQYGVNIPGGDNFALLDDDDATLPFD
jgi:single-strand DNA-binding protein